MFPRISSVLDTQNPGEHIRSARKRRLDEDRKLFHVVTMSWIHECVNRGEGDGRSNKVQSQDWALHLRRWTNKEESESSISFVFIRWSLNLQNHSLYYHKFSHYIFLHIFHHLQISWKPCRLLELFNAKDGFDEDIWDDSVLIRQYDRALQSSR